MRFVKLAVFVFASVAPVWPQAGQLKTADAVLDRYKQRFSAQGCGDFSALQTVWRSGRHSNPRYNFERARADVQ
jgi:hypothetical protein